MKSAMTVLVCILTLSASLLLSQEVLAEEKPLKVYILAGQSNMQGQGNQRTLPYMAKDDSTKPLLDKILDPNGKPRTYEDVRIVYFSEVRKTGPLTVGYGSGGKSKDVLGPELAFGITMYEKLGEPILIIKTAWGGKDIYCDFYPPGAGEPPYKLGSKKGKPREVGHYYRRMIGHVRETLKDIKSVHPRYNEKTGYEIAGFVWFQGWNDMCAGDIYPNRNKPDGYALYTKLMAQFIRDVRKDLEAPKMPFVIGPIGVGGDQGSAPIKHLALAQAATAKQEEFQGNVAIVPTAPFWDHELEAAMKKRGALGKSRETAHRVTEEGTADWNVAGWKSIGTPAPQERVWRFTSFEPQQEKDRKAKKEKRRFRNVQLPAGLEKWHQPEFDDSAWESGKAPIGRGLWKCARKSHVKYQSDWGDKEFLLMRTTFDVKHLDYKAFRISILANQGFQIYLNGHKIHTYIWWKDQPYYRSIVLGKNEIARLKTGRNVLAIYANKEYPETMNPRHKTPELGVIDCDIEGITEEGEEELKAAEEKICPTAIREIAAGASNGGYHYLGSAKMLTQIGRAFAEAMATFGKK